MLTAAAQSCLEVAVRGGVASRASLRDLGVSPGELRARVDAGRWQVCGNAVVLHNGPLTRRQRWSAALITVGPRAMLTAFTAAEYQGLRGWTRDEVHVLAPLGVAQPDPGVIPVRVHRTRSWYAASDKRLLRCERLAPALVRAASTFSTPRPPCGLLAAGVQQGLVSPGELDSALTAAPKTRHRKALIAAVRDIAGGSQALSEIDFVRLCRAHGLPEPVRQLVRVDGAGLRRYLDASWRRADGRLVVVEIDGALHLSPRRWWQDQLRQNELMLADALVLRFPSVVVRTEPSLVIAHLRRALS